VDSAFIQMILGQSGMGGIAALAMWLMNKAHQDALRREVTNSELMRTERAELIRVMNETTRAITALESAIDALAYGEEYRGLRRPHQSDQS
jgi:hypothetical protein